MADLNDIEMTEGTADVLHPATGKPIGLRLHLVNVDDDKLSKTRRAIADRRLYLEARGKNFKAEEIEDNALRLAVDALTGWEWYNPTGAEGEKDYDPEEMGSWKGEQPEFSRKMATEIVREKKWIGTFIRKEISENDGFFGD